LRIAVRAAAEGISPIIKRALDYAKEAGVHGADEVISSANHLPRLWKFDVMSQIIKGATKEGLDSLKKQLAQAIKGKDSYAQAERMIDWFSNNKNFTGSQSDDLFNRLEDFLAEGTTKEDVADAVRSSADKASRLKNRLNIDMSKINLEIPMKDGTSLKIDSSTLVKRDINEVVDSYLNQMYGSIVMAKRNYPSITDLRQSIAEIGGKEAEALTTAVDLLLGQPLKINNQGTHEIATTLKNITFIAALPLVLFSMIPEAVKTIANVGLGNVLKNFGPAFKNIDKTTENFRLLTEMTGIGTHIVRDKIDVKGLDNADIGELGVNSWHAKGSTELVQKAAQFFGLVRGTDFLQKLNLMHSSNEFAKFINGMEFDIPTARLDSYGMDNSTKKMFKGDFKFNDNGELLSINKDSWSLEKRTKFNDILFRLNQEVTPDVVLGTIGRWTKDTDLGRTLSFLLSYPLNLFANQAVKDARYMDTRTMSNTVFTVAGTYIGLAAKYEAQGRDYTHEQLMMYSIMNLPSMAIVSAGRGLLDSAVLGMASDFKNDVDTMAGGIVDN
jgi:hypothetical protein